MSKRRFQYHVTYDSTHGGGWQLKVGGALVLDRHTKHLLIRDAGLLLDWFGEMGQHSELVIHTRKRIGRGPGSRRTYPRSSDPVRSRG